MKLKENKKDKLVLLGAWDEQLLLTWPWFSDIAIKHFYQLTNTKLYSFTYSKDKLHYQFFFATELNKIKKRFDKLTHLQKINEIERICHDYYIQAKKAKKILDNLEKKKYKKLETNNLVVDFIRLLKAFSLTTIQIWLILILDIWYPQPSDILEVKKIGAKARDHSGKLHERGKKLQIKLCKDIAKKIKIPTHDIYYLFPDEIQGIISKKYPIHSIDKIVESRKKIFVTTNLDGSHKIYSDKKAKRLLNKYKKNEKDKNKKILKGLPASPGKTKGKVHKILLRNEFGNFKKGEILVALQTMVDYVPIMKKAKAILTEFGGITSHAAIVSRELNKPCIVGITGITASLKDGDMIEVDANKGVVRKLG